MNIIQELETEQMAAIEDKRKLPDFSAGDTLRVNVRVTEGTRTRVQAYEGVCISRSGGGLNESFTVRKISYGEGVERVFPLFSPLIESIDVVRRGKVRRAKLYYLRGRRGKSAPHLRGHQRAHAPPGRRREARRRRCQGRRRGREGRGQGSSSRSRRCCGSRCRRRGRGGRHRVRIGRLADANEKHPAGPSGPVFFVRR